jgi:hypothetical protein
MAGMPARRCPANGVAGAAVSLRTVKALLMPQALGRVSRLAHYYCADAVCDVVYFDEGGQCFTRADVTVAVADKDATDRRPFCYCFGFLEADVRGEAPGGGPRPAIEAIRGHVAAGRCGCDVRNPTGRCCLGARRMGGVA